MSIKKLFKKMLGEEEDKDSSGYYEMRNSSASVQEAGFRKVPVSVIKEEKEEKIPEDIQAVETKNETEKKSEGEGMEKKGETEHETASPSPFLYGHEAVEEAPVVNYVEKSTVDPGAGEKAMPVQEPSEIEAPRKSTSIHAGLKKKFERAIALIEDVTSDEFIAKYGKTEPVFEGDYRKMLSEMLGHIADHPVDKFPAELTKRFQDAEKLVHDLLKRDHESKLIVTDGKTYLVKKDLETGQERPFDLLPEERTYIISHLPVIESFVEEEIKGLELEKSYLGSFLDDFKSLKIASLLAIGIKDRFKCSDEDAARAAKDIIKRSEKGKDKHKK